MNSHEKDSRGILAVVSPCSTCKVQRAFPEPGENGAKNFCPRRHWKEVGDAMVKLDDPKARFLRHLTLTGTDDDSLVNPVYDSEGNSTLVWVANIQDNEERRDASGAVVNPSIAKGLDGFDTSFIVCSSLPFLPEDSAVGYNQSGRLEEGEPVLTTSLFQQTEEDAQQNVHCGGSVRRTSLLYVSPRAPIHDNNSPDGV